MTDDKAELTAVDGNGQAPPPAEPIAFSLVVYERRCLDIPASGITRLEACPTRTFVFEGQGPVTLDMPHVAIWLAPRFQERLRDLARDSAGDTMDLVVGGQCISRPILRAPLGNEASFLLSADDLAGAQALAEKLESGWRRLTTGE